jgi:hypothetical protein
MTTSLKPAQTPTDAELQASRFSSTSNEDFGSKSGHDHGTGLYGRSAVVAAQEKSPEEIPGLRRFG